MSAVAPSGAAETLTAAATDDRSSLTTAGADSSDIAENFFEEARVTAKCWGLIAFGADFGNQFFAGLRHRRNIASLVETDLEHILIFRCGLRKCQLLGVARIIIPVILVELANKCRPAKRCLNRLLIVDTWLNRAQQRLVANISLMGL
jgi:hypothetical protein